MAGRRADAGAVRPSGRDVAGLAVTGLAYTPARPAATRLAHLRAVLAIHLSLEAVS